MSKIGPTIFRANRARAFFINRKGVFLVPGVADLDLAEGGKELAVSRVPGRDHTVEKVDPKPGHFDEVFGKTDPHCVSGEFFGDHRRDVGGDLVKKLLRFSDRETAEGEPLETTDLQEAFGALFSQLFVDAALDDAEQ